MNTYEFSAARWVYKNVPSLFLIESNYRARIGEVDLIGIEAFGEVFVLCFIEVRFRSSSFALETIGPRKQKRIRKVASLFLSRYAIIGVQEIRFDALVKEGKCDWNFVRAAWDY